MRMKSIIIDSFGKLKGKSFDLTPGLNVFYGPNESGKSTTMEFIRCTFVPNRSNKNSYPERLKTDSGSIVYEEERKEKRVLMEGKTGHKGEVPECVTGMDPVLYRSIFAMNREGLDEMDSLSNGDIRSRFLTIPGGETMPMVIKSIDDDWERLIGKTATSPSAIISLQKKEDKILEEIASLRSNAESYSELSSRKGELEKKLEIIGADNKAAMENNDRYSKVESQRSNFESLRRYREQRDQLLKRPILQEGAQSTFLALKKDADAKKAAYEALESSRRKQIDALPGADENRLIQMRPRIQSVVDRQSEYHSRLSRPTPPVQTSSNKMPFVLMAVLAIVAVAVWLIPGVDTIIPIVADIALIAAIALIYLKAGRRTAEPMQFERDPWLTGYEAEVRTLSSELGVGAISTDSD
ncbi:MAG: AAA family ATPase, partial [Candidatus Methanomethylophilaceae archaeon]|nr:AAA family ATPase [Candidatus Methanomethylophilaceae archaeon]